MIKRKSRSSVVLAARGCKARNKIQFDRASADIRVIEILKLRRLAIILRRSPDATVVIRGNTVGRGDNSYNKSLGQQRADAVAGQLLRLGVAPHRLMSLSVGKKRSFVALSPLERIRRRRAEMNIIWGTVAELRRPALLMEFQPGHRMATGPGTRGMRIAA